MEAANKENSPTDGRADQAGKSAALGEATQEKSALQESNTNTATTQSTDGALKEPAPKVEDAKAEEEPANQIVEKKPKQEPDFFNAKAKSTSLQDHFNRFRKAKK